MDYEIDVIFEAEDEFLPKSDEIISLITKILENHKAKQAEISIAFVNDAEIIELNKNYFNKSTPTDVISFNLDEESDNLEVLDYKKIPQADADVLEQCVIENEFVEGEIIVNADEAARAAGDYGNTSQQEVLTYVIHGLLHILGYDDLEEQKKKIMWIFQNYYFDKFVISEGS